MFVSPLLQTNGILYLARHPSPTPTRVDLSLLLGAMEDSWTPSFLYESPSESDSSDSDLITAGNKQNRQHLGSGFIFSLSHYFFVLILPEKKKNRKNNIMLHWNWCAAV